MNRVVYFLIAFVLVAVLAAIAIPAGIALWLSPAYSVRSDSASPTPQIVESGQLPKSYTSSLYGYTVRYPDWDLKVNTSAPAGPGSRPEYLTMSPAENRLPIVNIYALTGADSFTGYENCAKNASYAGLKACRISKPAGQIPATEIVVFQKGDAHFLIALQYEDPASKVIFDQIISQFEFSK